MHHSHGADVNGPDDYRQPLRLCLFKGRPWRHQGFRNPIVHQFVDFLGSICQQRNGQRTKVSRGVELLTASVSLISFFFVEYDGANR